MTKKIVIQISGGIESTTAMYKALNDSQIKDRRDIHLIAFDTDSIFWRHRDSIAIKRVVTEAQMQQQLYTCRMPNPDHFEYVRDDLYADVGFIPGYKLMFNTVSLAYAQRVGASEVWVGNMSDNVYPDESPEFMNGTSELYNRTYTSESRRVGFVEPFKGMTKGEVIQLAIKLGVPLADTVSCGEERTAGGYNCGICPWCTKRRAGFLQAGVEDPTTYLFK